MANADLVDGFRPHGTPLRTNRYLAGGTIYPNDLVKPDGNGAVVVVAAGDATLGAAKNYAVSGEYVWVYDDPNQQFECQSDDASIDNADDSNANYDVVCGSANTTYKRSGMELDGDTGGTLATRQLKLLRIVPSPNNALGANVKCIVLINNHCYKGGTGTAGLA